MRVDTGESRVYSIDYYKLLDREPQCQETLEMGGVRLCYVGIGEGCQAVVSIVQGRVELVNLRLIERNAKDKPLSLREAREACVERAEQWLKREDYAD